MLERFLGHDRASPSRRLTAAKRAAHLDRLAGDDGRDRMALVHGIGVHDPRHDPLVGIHVRSWHIGIRTERRDDADRVTPGQALELAHAELTRIADHATLGATERQVHHRAFPGHPGGERLHFLERHREIEPDASLGGAPRRVVQHTISLEDLDLATVHHDGDRDDDLFFGVPEHLVQARLEIEELRGSVEAGHHRFEGVLFV